MSPPPPPVLQFALRCLAVLATAWPNVVPATPAAGDRDHHLFVGIDLYLNHGDTPTPVRRFEGDAAVLDLGAGRTAAVPRANGFQWRLRPKVSPAFIRIEDVETTAAYSPAADPARAELRRQIALQGYHDDREAAADRDLVRGLARAATAQQQESLGVPLPPDASSAAIAEQSLAGYETARAAIAPLNDPAMYSPRRDDHDPGDRDALEVHFTVAADRPVAETHVLAMVRIRTPDQTFRDFSFQRRLGALGPAPKTFTLLQAGLPPGFICVETRLHIFSRSHELATNHSERRFALTASEAHDYLRLDHAAQHRGVSRPAEPVWALAPPLLATADSADVSRFDFAVEVEVNEVGQATAVHAPPGQILPAEVRAVIAEMTYLPALSEGIPTASTVTINPARYFD